MFIEAGIKKIEDEKHEEWIFDLLQLEDQGKE